MINFLKRFVNNFICLILAVLASAGFAIFLASPVIVAVLFIHLIDNNQGYLAVTMLVSILATIAGVMSIYD